MSLQAFSESERRNTWFRHLGFGWKIFCSFEEKWSRAMWSLCMKAFTLDGGAILCQPRANLMKGFTMNALNTLHHLFSNGHKSVNSLKRLFFRFCGGNRIIYQGEGTVCTNPRSFLSNLPTQANVAVGLPSSALWCKGFTPDLSV